MGKIIINLRYEIIISHNLLRIYSLADLVFPDMKSYMHGNRGRYNPNVLKIHIADF
jgi:hypothetical protein